MLYFSIRRGIHIPSSGVMQKPDNPIKERVNASNILLIYGDLMVGGRVKNILCFTHDALP
jgi:hypothetical protein